MSHAASGRLSRQLFLLPIILITAPILLSLQYKSADAQASPNCAILVFSKTAGFRHSSIGAGQTAIDELVTPYAISADFSEDSADFTAANLDLYDAVIFLNTTGDILTTAQEAAFEAYIQAGNGFVGIHSATDTEYNWAWYDSLIGTHFRNHPAQQDATVTIIDNTHPSTAHLGVSWDRFDEWYNFLAQPVGVNVLLAVDESTYSGGNMGDPHPISWNKLFDGGRSWYTAMGHTASSYSEPDFRQHLLGGILWAADIETCVLTAVDTQSVGGISRPSFEWVALTVVACGLLGSTLFALRKRHQV